MPQARPERSIEILFTPAASAVRYAVAIRLVPLRTASLAANCGAWYALESTASSFTWLALGVPAFSSSNEIAAVSRRNLSSGACSVRPVSSEYKQYKEGEKCEELNKTVHMLVVSTPDFFVFLDEDLYVQWLTKGDFDTSRAGEVLNHISYLETISTTHFSGLPRQLKELAEFRRLLGECLARAFDGNLHSAHELLQSTEELLHERSAQRARQWYLSAAGLAALVPFFGALILWGFRGQFRQTLGLTAFDVLLGVCLGGIGALVSTIVRVRKVNLNAAFGPNLHCIEGVARIVTGSIGAGLVTLAIKGNLLFGSFNAIAEPSMRLACVCVVALVAGTSERIVPNLIKKVEKSGFDDQDPPKAARTAANEHESETS